MAKKMLIDATHAEETRVVVADGNRVEEFDFETINKRQLAGNIYLAKITRVEPSLQAAFVDYGGNRHGFLAFAEIHPDYYQIPLADRQAILAEERAYADALEAEESARARRRSTPRPAARAESAASKDAVTASDAIEGMDVYDFSADLAESADDEQASDVAPVILPEPIEVPVEASPGGDLSADEAYELRAEAEPEPLEPYVAADHATETDDEIESVAEEDVAEEIQVPRKPRPRRYKIQEVIKVRQIMLVQVVKEERGNKGAALTTYLSLAGRYCVLMPNTARGGGISRKITNAADRKKLKEIAGEMEVPEGAGLIIRTAGSQRTKTEIKRDYEYLMRLWGQIRDLTLKSVAPAPIYEEGDLIKRSIRDLYSKDIDEVIVEGERGYRAAKDFMKMIMPSHASVVKRYADPLPLFARYQVESYLTGMFNPVVQLKSGGYIVIGVTEALVAIDVNSGRATKEGSIEDTALKTNVEAAEEIARQLRLRDLAGLIVIDFIDMEERRNNATVEKKLKDKLKTDRARIQVGRISGFGLLEMSRQRLRPGMLESTTQPCAHCHGTGLIRSDESLALQILRQIEEEGTRKRSREVLLRAPVAVVNFLMNQKREHVAQIEARYGMAVRIEADPALVSPDFSIEKFKTATRFVPETATQVVSADAALMGEYEEEEPVEAVEEDEDDTPAAATAATSGEEGPGPKKKRRRRRKKKGSNGAGQAQGVNGEGLEDDVSDDGAEDGSDDGAEDTEAAAESAAPVTEAAEAMDEAAEAATDDAPAAKPKSSRSRSRSKKAAADVAGASETAEAAAVQDADAEEVEKPRKTTRSRSRKSAAKTAEAEMPAEVTDAAPEPIAEPAPMVAEVMAEPEASVGAPAGFVPETPVEVQPETIAAQPEPPVEPTVEPAVQTPAAPDLYAAAEPAFADTGADDAEADSRPKRRGWWSR